MRISMSMTISYMYFSFVVSIGNTVYTNQLLSVIPCQVISNNINIKVVHTSMF